MFDPCELALYACTVCRTPHRGWAVPSAEPWGIRRWTDGLIEERSLRLRPPLVSRCAQCAAFFWVTRPLESPAALLTNLTALEKVVTRPLELAVVISAAGASWIKTAAVLRRVLDLSLREARDWLHTLPRAIPVDELDAPEALVTELRLAGATADVVGQSGASDAGGGPPYVTPWSTLPRLPRLDEDALLVALDDGLASAPDVHSGELLLRREIWWAGNAAFRAGRRPWREYAARPRRAGENLSRLDELLSQLLSPDWLARAEIARQRGDFGPAEEHARKASSTNAARAARIVALALERCAELAVYPALEYPLPDAVPGLPEALAGGNELLLTWLRAFLPAPVRIEQRRGVSVLEAGAPGLVVVELSRIDLSVAVYQLGWAGPHTVEARHRRIAQWELDELRGLAKGAYGELSAAVAQAIGERRSRFSFCRFCHREHPAEHGGGGVCHGCAERYLGAVH